MRYQVGDACFSTLGGAASVVASQESGKVVPAGSAVFVVDAVGDSGGAITYTLHDLTGTVTDQVQVRTPTFAECQLLTVDDGLSMGWKVLAAWFLVYAVMFIKRAL